MIPATFQDILDTSGEYVPLILGPQTGMVVPLAEAMQGMVMGITKADFKEAIKVTATIATMVLKEEGSSAVVLEEIWEDMDLEDMVMTQEGDEVVSSHAMIIITMEQNSLVIILMAGYSLGW